MKIRTLAFGSAGFGNRVPMGLFVVAILVLPKLLLASDPFTIVAIPDTQIYARSVQATNDYFIPQMRIGCAKRRWGQEIPAFFG